MELLGRDFYNRDTVTVARDLLGKHLVRVLDDGTELYLKDFLGFAEKVYNKW